MNTNEPGGTGGSGWIRIPGLRRGSTVGRYLVIGLLGKGGSGEVYAAYDPELERKIALKLLRPHAVAGMDPTEGRLRLLREAQAIARLSDPNVVVIFDVGTFGDRVFLAMEFLDGNTLGYWLTEKPRTWREVVKTFTAAGRGLASAHKAGLVHRDFKPDNVMMGKDGQVRVMDFGLARTIDPMSAEEAAADLVRTGSRPSKPALANVVSGAIRAITEKLTDSAVPAGGEWNESDTSTRDLSRAAKSTPEGVSSAFNTRLTETGAMMGTPAYMAPEQLKGGTIDARTDQFSFCAALYEGLYGERPFAGRNIHELTENVSSGRVREAPTHARIPGWLRKIVLVGLRVNRTERHPSMEALLEALGRDPARTRRRWASAAAVVGLIAILGVGLFRAERRQRLKCGDSSAKLAGIWELPKGATLSARKEAIRQAFMATGKPYAANSFTVVRNALDRYVVAWNDMHRDACEATHVRGEQSSEVLDLRMSCLQDRFSEVRALASVLSTADGDVVSKSVAASQALRAIEPCADVTALRAVVRPPDDAVIRRAVADVRSRLADVKALTNAGKYKKATDQLPPILEAARRTTYPPVIAEALLHLADIQTVADEAAKAETNYEQALWIAEGSRHDEVVVHAAAQLIYVSGYLRGHYSDGERWARHATAALRRLGPGHDVVAGWRANNLGLMYEKEGRLEESLNANLEAVALKTRALGPEHFDVGISQLNVALALFRLGRIDEAIDRGQNALTFTQRALGPEHPQVAFGLLNTAEFMNAKGRHHEASTMANRAMVIWEREAAHDHPFVGYALTIVGQILIDDGRPALATQHLERALRIRETSDRDPMLLGETRFALARSLWDSNQTRERAMSLAMQARTEYEKEPRGKMQEANVQRWIEAHLGRPQRVVMR